MPHLTLKMYPGKSDELKQNLAKALSEKIQSMTGCKDEAISLSIEEIEAKDWPEKVYRPDILANQSKLYKKPGYNPF